MRKAVIEQLKREMKKDKNLVVLLGDVGYGLFDSLREKYPSRVINVGLSEQAMIGLAAGLALEGKRVVVYSIIPFLLYRSYEQILNDVAYNGLPVILLGTAEGFTYGHDAVSHHALQDLSLSLSIPNLQVCCPADKEEAVMLFKEALASRKPCYIRLSKNSEEKQEYSDGYNSTVISTGGISIEVEKAVRKLNRGIRHCHVGRIKPLVLNEEEQCIDWNKPVISVEEHDRTLGFGAYVMAQTGKPIKIIGVENKFQAVSGSRPFMLKANGLDADSLALEISKLLPKERPFIRGALLGVEEE